MASACAPACSRPSAAIAGSGLVSGLRRLGERLVDYGAPLAIFAVSVWYLLLTLVTQPHKLADWEAFRHEWFRRFFTFMGPQCSNKTLIHAAIRSTLADSAGTILDLGPGLGGQLPHLAPSAARIARVYGFEPTKALHPVLEQAVADAGLEGKYEIIPLGAQVASMVPALARRGVGTGDVDRVLGVMVMCSVAPAELDGVLAAVQALLRPGGEYVFVEHVANHEDAWSDAYQRFLDVVWPFFMGGCRLQNPLAAALERMPGWAKVEVTPLPGARGFESIPFVSGRAVKA